MLTVGELVEQLGGKLVQGSPRLEIGRVSECAQAKPDSLVFADSRASLGEAEQSSAGAVVLDPKAVAVFPEGQAVIRSEQPRLWFARAAKLLKPAPSAEGVHPSAVVPASAALGEGVSIGPMVVLGEYVSIGAGSHIGAGAVIGDRVRLGDHCRIYPRAVMYAGTTVGNGVIVHAGAVLGADGFGYVRDSTSGAYTQFPQQGTLVIEDDVEIGANSTIDRGALAETRIRRGTKIDNLVHIGHNCNIGEDVIIVSGTGISGSSTVGNGAVLAGQVGIGDHAHIGPGVILGGQAGVLSGKTVTKEGLRPGTVLWGTPARPLTQVLREIAIVGRLAKRAAKATPKDAEESGRGARDQV
jgi:UDP-3-O-[3-hydroxymyristoyl] glucosamine N-acyltransferase